MKLTVTVITYNEADHIQHALESVAWADEIIVVDSGSTDGTVDLARPLATQVIVRSWPGYSEQKNFAADSASNDWVLSIDADERVTPELAAEIRALMSRGPEARGYRIKRVSRYLGRWIRSYRLVSRLPAPALRPACRAVERLAHPRILSPHRRQAGPPRR